MSAAKSNKKQSHETSGVEEISASLSAMIKALCDRHLTGIVVAFTQQIAEQSELSPDACIKIWNEVAPAYLINQESSKKSSTTVEGKICCFYFVRAKKDCDREVSVKSITGKYCSSHIKEETKPEKIAKEEVAKVPCSHSNTKGDDIGKACPGFVSAKSTTGKYCAKHAKTMEKEKPSKEKPSKEKSEPDAVEFAPKFNRELKIYADPATGFIVNKADKKVYARLLDGAITQLTDKDTAYLVEHGYEFDESLFAVKHPDLISGDDEEEEEEEDAN